MNFQSNKTAQEAVLQLLQQTRLRQDEVDSRFNSAMSPDYWRELNPGLSVNGASEIGALQGPPLTSQRQGELLRKLEREGYLQAEMLVSSPTIDLMRECVERLRKNDWPAVFAFVYDEFWLLTRTSSMTGLLSSALGSEYKQLPHVWGHYVRERVGAGWQPHTDCYEQPQRLTVWVALNDATLDSGCIYLIPRDRLKRDLADRYNKREDVDYAALKTLLHAARALPVRAGTVLCWNHDIIHWGSPSLQSKEPRISVSQEFIGPDAETTEDEQPLLDHISLPGFNHRLLMIGQAIATYHRFEPLTIRYLDLANRLIAESQ